MPKNVAHAPPSLGPSRNLAGGAKDVPPSRPDEHSAFVDVTIHKAFRTSKKDGGVGSIMQKIIKWNKNICRIIVVRNVLIQGGARASCRDRSKSGHPFEAEVRPRQNECALLVGSGGLLAQSPFLFKYGLSDQECNVIRPNGHAVNAGQGVMDRKCP